METLVFTNFDDQMVLVLWIRYLCIANCIWCKKKAVRVCITIGIAFVEQKQLSAINLKLINLNTYVAQYEPYPFQVVPLFEL